MQQFHSSSKWEPNTYIPLDFRLKDFIIGSGNSYLKNFIYFCKAPPFNYKSFFPEGAFEVIGPSLEIEVQIPIGEDPSTNSSFYSRHSNFSIFIENDMKAAETIESIIFDLLRSSNREIGIGDQIESLTEKLNSYPYLVEVVIVRSSIIVISIEDPDNFSFILTISNTSSSVRRPFSIIKKMSPYIEKGNNPEVIWGL